MIEDMIMEHNDLADLFNRITYTSEQCYPIEVVVFTPDSLCHYVIEDEKIVHTEAVDLVADIADRIDTLKDKLEIEMEFFLENPLVAQFVPPCP